MRDIAERETGELVSSRTVVRVARYLFIFWGVCVVSGAGMAVGLAHAGMKPQDAFNSGMIVAFLPGLVALVSGFIYLMYRMWTA